MASVSLTPDEYSWASKTAMKLRQLQSDFGDETPERRKAFLDDEVQRELKNVVAEKRPRYIQALAEHFPTGFISKPVDATPAENSPEALVDALVKIAGKLPPSLKADLGLRLQEAGYMEIKSTVLLDAPPEDLCKTLQLDDSVQIDITRLYRALNVFAEYYFRLEKAIWQTWQKIGHQSSVKQDRGPQADVGQLARRYLQRDTDVSSEQLKQQVEKTRMVLAGIIGAVPTGAEAFLEQFCQEFAPEKVELLAKSDKELKGGWGAETKFWNKYKRMMADQTGSVFNEKFYDALARAAEDLMLGTGRK